MRGFSILVFIIFVSSLLTACQTAVVQTPTASATQTMQPSPSATFQPTETHTPTSSHTPTPHLTNTPAPTHTPNPTHTPTPASVNTWFAEVISISDAFPEATRAGNLFVTEDGSLMLIIDGVIAKFIDNSWETILESWPGRLLIWQGQIWAYDEETDELSHWQGNNWQSYGAEAGWTAIEAGHSDMMAAYDGSDRFWVATRNDVRMLANGSWRIFTPADMGIDLEPDPSGATSHKFTIQPVPILGEVWVGHCRLIPPGPSGGKGLRRFDGQTWQTNADDTLTDGCTMAMAADALGRVFVSQDDTLWLYDVAIQQWHSFASPTLPADQHMTYGAILDITTSPTGQVWPLYLACGGASCSVGEHRYQFEEDGLFYPVWNPGDEARMPFLTLANGRVFKLTPTGFYEIIDHTPQRLLTPANAPRQMVIAPDGTVWATNQGQPQQLLKLKID